jgi:hypothetical protein
MKLNNKILNTINTTESFQKYKEYTIINMLQTTQNREITFCLYIKDDFISITNNLFNDVCLLNYEE